MRKFVLPLLLVVLTGPARAGEVDKVKLRKAVYLPTFSLAAGIGFSSEDGLVLMGDVRDIPAEIAALEKTLKGDDSDADRYYRLGRLYDKLKDKKAEQATDRAVEIYRRQLQARPDDGRLLAALGRALDAAGKTAEAETVLNRAIQAAPKEWSAWAARGHFLTGRAQATLLHGSTDLTAVFQAIVTRQVPPADLARSRADFQEALRCLDEAVRLAPDEPGARSERALFRFTCGFFQAGMQVRAGQRANPMAAVFCDDCLADVKQLARLCPADPRAVGIAAAFEVLMFMAHNPDKVKSVAQAADALPADSRKSVREDLDRLEQIAKGQDVEAAARAEEIQGLLSFMAFPDKTGTEHHLRRALALSPQRDQSWDLLLGTLARDERYQDCLTAALERLRHKDNAHNRFLAAKTYEYLNDYARAEEQVRLGLAREPDDLHCRLALAALLLRHDEDAAVVQAGKELDRCAKLLQPSSPADARDDYLVLRSVFLALSGDQRQARALLAGLLQRDKDNKKASEAQAALGN
jgi:tetratricopeptide (TPR) repeat protein